MGGLRSPELIVAQHHNRRVDPVACAATLPSIACESSALDSATTMGSAGPEQFFVRVGGIRAHGFNRSRPSNSMVPSARASSGRAAPGSPLPACVLPDPLVLRPRTSPPPDVQRNVVQHIRLISVAHGKARAERTSDDLLSGILGEFIVVYCWRFCSPSRKADPRSSKSAAPESRDSRPARSRRPPTAHSDSPDK